MTEAAIRVDKGNDPCQLYGDLMVFISSRKLQEKS
jgi:hypothetical protein